MLLDEWDETASIHHVLADMETTRKESADEILGKLRQKRNNERISNISIHLAAAKREARKRGDVTEYNIIYYCEMRYNDSYVEKITGGWRTNAMNLISTIAQAKQDAALRKIVNKTHVRAKQVCIRREYNEELSAKYIN